MKRSNFPRRLQAKRELALKNLMAGLAKLKDDASDLAKKKRERMKQEILNLNKKLGHAPATLGVATT